jgi:hypothetical protein
MSSTLSLISISRGVRRRATTEYNLCADELGQGSQAKCCQSCGAASIIGSLPEQNERKWTNRQLH